MGDRGPNARPVKKKRVAGVFHLPKVYSENRIERNIQFIESLPVTSGVLAGTKFKLRSFQLEIIENLYRTDSEGKREVRESVISMPRKNGKTGLSAVLGILHFCGPEAIPRGQVYCCATERQQSGLLYEEMKAIIELVPELSRRVSIKDFNKHMLDVETGSVFYALSADAAGKHGYSSSCWIYDELAQAPNRKLYEAISSSTGAHAEPLGIVISTQNGDPNHVMSELVHYGRQLNSGEFEDKTFYAFVTAAPEEADPWDEKTWYACNPALGDYRSLEELRTESIKAQRMPAREPSFRLLYLNQQVQSEASLISKADWQACAATHEVLRKGEEVYLGLDLSGTKDLTALVATSATNGERLKAWFWKPGDTLAEHSRKDRAPYERWVKEGWIEAPKGGAIDYNWVAFRIAAICQEYKVLGMAYDRWHMPFLIKEFDRMGIPYYEWKDSTSRGQGLPMVDWGQGFKDMSPSLTAWENAILNRTLKHDSNPVLAMCVANAIVAKPDPAGNRKLDKSATRFRIDGAVAAVMSIGLKAKDARKEAKFQMMFV